MSDLMRYKQPNWIDGMKINKDHFIALENHFTARINDQNYNDINSHNYGLLPPQGDQEKFLSISVNIDNQNYLKVKLDSCHAITPGGYRIGIFKNNTGREDFILKNVETEYNLASTKDGELFLIISVDPFSRVPEGKADPNEYPLRLPYINHEYKLHLIPVEEFKDNSVNFDMLPVARISIKNNKPEVSEEYIPPCTTINSYEKLISFYEYIDKNISSLEKDTVKIIYDINEKGGSNILTEIVSFLTDKLLYYISTNITGFRSFFNTRPPLYVFEFVISMARVLRNNFDIRSAEEKEVLLNYFSEHFDIVPSRFKQLLDNTISMTYNHMEIYEAVKKSEDFLNVISVLFHELSKMELIAGQKKEEPRKIDITLR